MGDADQSIASSLRFGSGCYIHVGFLCVLWDLLKVLLCEYRGRGLTFCGVFVIVFVAEFCGEDVYTKIPA